MFGKLKEKLKSWTQSFTKREEKEEIAVDESKSEKPSKKEKKPQKQETKSKVKEAEEEFSKLEEEKEAKAATKVREIKKEIEPGLDERSSLITKSKEKEITNIEVKKSKEIEVPVKFDVLKNKYEPDLEKIKDIKEDLEYEVELKPIEQKEAIVEKHEEIKQKEKKGFFGKLKEKFKGKEKVEEIKELEKLSEESKKVENKEISQKELKTQETDEQEEKSFFSKLKSSVTKTKISDKDFENYGEELKMLLLENNVAYEVAEVIIFKLKQKIVGKEILRKELENEIRDSLRDTIEGVLLNPFNIIDKVLEKGEKPYTIMFCGINGTGKTTTIAKIANMLKEKHLTCVIAAGDTFRAASIEQIKQHGDNLGIKVIAHDYGSDPASVGFDAVSYAKKNSIDVVLIDTAGRMHTEKNLLKEIEKISRVCKPDLKIFVGEAITGNDSIEQIRAFDTAIGIDAIILSKADTDEKGGTSLSVGHVTRKPILYLGTGQRYTDLELFDKRKFTEKLGL